MAAKNVNVSDDKQENQVTCQAFVQSFFENLGLWQKYYPQRLTIFDSLHISEKTLNAVSCTGIKDLPWLILQKIMRFDAQSIANLFNPPDTVDFDDSDEDFADELDEKFVPMFCSDKIHPMDVILALFLCADDFLRQDMMVKLTSCQLAIPLVLRDPFTQELTLPLWALSSIVMSWRTVDSNGKIVNFEHQLTKFEMPIVSIIRLGNHEVSKSKLLNNVISSSNQQDYFFHRDCNGGSFKRLIGNGIIDMCWYLPTGKEDIFPKPITFVNLHGDACDSMNERQVEFLSQISMLCLILSPGSSLNAESVDILKKFHSFTLLIKGKTHTNLKEQFSKKVHTISLTENEEDEIKVHLRREINSVVFSTDASNKAIQLFDNFAHNCQIKVDSRGKSCLNGQAMASLSFAKINSKPCFKAKNLPLQGKTMWQAWATYDKEQKRQMNRGGKDIQEYQAEIEEKKCQIRTEQRKQLTELSPIMKSFVENLKQCDSKAMNYYLYSLKMHLDSFSKETVSKVCIQYCDKGNELTKCRKSDGHTNTEIKQPRDKFELINVAVGLEHLLREIAQVYETSLGEKTPMLKKKFSHLPEAAAKLLINGYPIEVMDGDAAHVPIKWVQAVLKEVVEVLADPRIFVLAVLGLQSTDNSMLLNAMFGLHCSTSFKSSGKCTRGAYMQLLPISEDMRSYTECDYILVIDTEGLRAPELDSIQSQKHDNELATFVIGLANDTLINIYGEVFDNMDDILEPSVHAYIRMREIELKPSCQFVHQNAGAGSNIVKEWENIIQKLDEMTRYAASEEDCLDRFQHFRDVIKFDDQSDVHCIECSQVANPPMVPVNPEYIASAQSLKLRIICQIQETECSRLSSFSIKMKDLWDALLAENVAFGFNEIKAYSHLEKSYNQWEWELKEAVLTWEENILEEISLNEIALDIIIEENLNPIIDELTELISKTYRRLSEEMAKYFIESRQSEVIAQWKSIFERRLEEQAHLLKKEKIGHFEQLCTGKKALTKVRQQQDSFKQDIIKRVDDVVKVLKERNTKLTEEQVEVEFNKAWNEVIQKLPPVHRFQDPSTVKREVETELINYLGLGAEKIVVKLDKRKSQTALELSIDKKHHLSQNNYGSMKDAIKTVADCESITNSHVHQAQKETNMILNIIPQFFQEVRASTYSRTHVTLLLRELDAAIAQISLCEREFTFTYQYRADLFVIACNHAIKQFEQMVETFNRKNDPVIYLEEELKDDLFDIFKNECFKIEHGTAVASTLNEVLTESLINKVESSLAKQIVAKMKTGDICFKNKLALKAKILVNLAEGLKRDGDFDPFIYYLTSPRQSFQKWAKKYTRDYCDSHKPGNRLSNAQDIAFDEIKDLIFKVEMQVKDLRSKYESRSSTLSTCVWLSEFSENLLKEIGCHVDVSTIQKTSEGQTIDVVSFTITVEEEVKKVCEKVKKTFENLKFDDMHNWEKRAEDILGDMAGCCAQCPFCGEICDNTSPCGEGLKHQVEQHRPRIHDFCSCKTDVLCLAVCSSLVTGNDKCTHFYIGSSGKTHPYKEYYTVFPDWIIPASLETSSYWKWFVANYVGKLAEYYSCEVPSIPSQWQELKWENVKEELQRKYM